MKAISHESGGETSSSVYAPVCTARKQIAEYMSVKGTFRKTILGASRPNKVYRLYCDLLSRVGNPTGTDSAYKDVRICDDLLLWDDFSRYILETFDLDVVCKNRLCMDKDLLGRFSGGENVYSKDTITFIPHNVNCFFRKFERKSGSAYNGVVFRKEIDKWEARIKINGVRKVLGYFSSERAASDAHVLAKKTQAAVLACELSVLNPVASKVLAGIDPEIFR